jgi:lysophospholipase L1-like esterase
MRRVLCTLAVLAAVLVAAGPVVASPGASAAVRRAVPGVDPRVFVIGDSVILGAHDDLLARLAGWQVTFIAKESFFTWQAPAAIRAYHPTVGDITIVALGNNDGEDPGLFANEIDQVMGALGPVRKVLWVNLRQFRPWVPAANAQLVAATQRYANLEIVDWDARATPDPSLVYADGLHLNPAGRAAMADLIGQRFDAAVAQLTAPPPPPPTLAPATPPPTPAPSSIPAAASVRASATRSAAALAALSPLRTATPNVAVHVLHNVVVRREPSGASRDPTPDFVLTVAAAGALALAAVGLRRRRLSRPPRT